MSCVGDSLSFQNVTDLDSLGVEVSPDQNGWIKLSLRLHGLNGDGLERVKAPLLRHAYYEGLDSVHYLILLLCQLSTTDMDSMCTLHSLTGQLVRDKGL
jgi:hypothetical protein